MGWLENLRDRVRSVTTDDELLYEIVAEEIETGRCRKGLWAMALAETDFDDGKAKAKYLRLRVAALKSSFPNLSSVVREIPPLQQRREALGRRYAEDEAEERSLSARVELVSQHKDAAWEAHKALNARIRKDTRHIRRGIHMAGVLIGSCGVFIASALVAPAAVAIILGILGGLLGAACSLFVADKYRNRHPDSKEELRIWGEYVDRDNERTKLVLALSAVRERRDPQKSELATVERRLRELEKALTEALG